jgi:hypothetical protein
MEMEEDPLRVVDPSELLCCLVIIFTAFWQHKIAPVRFVLHTWTTSEGSMFNRLSLALTMPALFNQ